MPMVMATMTTAIVLPICLTQTSCGVTIATAQNKFEWKNAGDHTGINELFLNEFKKTYNTTDEAMAALADPAKYSDNQVKWDVIMGYMFGWRTDGKTTPFTGEFKDFQRNGTKIKYKVVITDSDKPNDPIEIYTTKDGVYQGEYDFSEIINLNLGKMGSDVVIGDLYSSYNLHTNMEIGGIKAFASPKSFFMYKPSIDIN